jgi:hypothetical protein
MRISKTTLLAAILIVMVALFATSCRYADDASDTLFKETKASTLLKKYEYFKDVAAALDAKKADIGVYERKFQDLKDQYKGVPRKDWARDDRESYNTWSQEVAGIKLSYNKLCADYNAQMSKMNWSFCNVGTLPQGATEPLPREFRQYLEQ